jgi:CheY-like chemotaxis protein
VERGARNPSLESVQKLADALELSLPILFERATNGQGQLVEILLVEDNARDIELTLRAFKKARLTNPVRIANDGQEALDFLFAPAQATASHPRIILLDLNLPKIGGLEVLRRIKDDQRTQKIPVVVLTVSEHDGDMAECRRLGVETYIVKPVGFQNFSAITATLSLDWMLVAHDRGQAPKVH